MRFHVVGLPHTDVTSEFSACAYTTRILNWCNMMCARGHEVFLYAGPKSDAKVTEFIPCITAQAARRSYRGKHYTEASFDPREAHWQKFNTKAIAQLQKRLQPRDFICLTAGQAQEAISEAFPEHLQAEIMVGYSGVLPRTHKVFESYAWMHSVYTQMHGGVAFRSRGRFFDAVIPPNYPLPGDFGQIVLDEVADYFLFLGRKIELKGVGVVSDIAKATKLRIIAAGPGQDVEGVENVGVVGPAKRTELLRGAVALIAPTLYVEPFGNVAVEAQICGCPVISTDWGAFTETVINGKTGYRCRDLREFVVATDKVRRLDRNYIARTARAKYSDWAISERYEHFFRRLNKLWQEGWAAGTAAA